MSIKNLEAKNTVNPNTKYYLPSINCKSISPFNETIANSSVIELAWTDNDTPMIVPEFQQNWKKGIISINNILVETNITIESEETLRFEIDFGDNFEVTDNYEQFFFLSFRSCIDENLELVDNSTLFTYNTTGIGNFQRAVQVNMYNPLPNEVEFFSFGFAYVWI